MSQKSCATCAHMAERRGANGTRHEMCNAQAKARPVYCELALRSGNRCGPRLALWTAKPPPAHSYGYGVVP